MDFNYWIEIANKVVNIITGPAVIFSVWFLVALSLIHISEPTRR